MKVLLINPPVKNLIKSEVPGLVKQNEGLFPPLGLLYLAAYLKEHIDCEIGLLDALAENMDYSAIKQYIINFQPDIAGITVHTHNLIDAILTAQIVKQADSDIYVCWGGPHVNIFPRESINVPCVDFVVLGEGEIVFFELVRCLKNKGNLKDVEGILFKQGDEIILTGERKDVIPLDILPLPDRSLLNYKKYSSILGKNTVMATLVSSRGCPYECSFCSTPRGKYRVRSARNIADEMQECVKLGIREIHFVDDTFNVYPERVEAICKEIKERKLKIDWSFRGRVEGLTKSLLKKLKGAGCYRIHLGVETSTDEGLRDLKKGITVEQIKYVFKSMREAGINSVAYFLLGCPHERSKEDILRTINFSKEINPDFVLFNILTPYPFTELYKEGVKKGLFRSDYWREFVLNPRKDFVPCFWEEYFSKEELLELLLLAYKQFYLRPKFLMKVLTNHQNLKSFFRKIKTGIDILKS